MKNEVLPLKEISIAELFNGTEKATYEVPIYQRNYAWEKDEISALIQDVYDSFQKKINVYYIGTLVSYYRGDRVYEIIDGQQRLTTIRLILGALGIAPSNRLTYRARKRSDNTIASIPKFDRDEMDRGIMNGYKYAESALGELVAQDLMQKFTGYFLNNVHIIHYCVPKDIDLNHYFEIMNSRGEQLEKHEIIKARLLSELSDPAERAVFTAIWAAFPEMALKTFSICSLISMADTSFTLFRMAGARIPALHIIPSAGAKVNRRRLRSPRPGSPSSGRTP